MIGKRIKPRLSQAHNRAMALSLYATSQSPKHLLRKLDEEIRQTSDDLAAAITTKQFGDAAALGRRLDRLNSYKQVIRDSSDRAAALSAYAARLRDGNSHQLVQIGNCVGWLVDDGTVFHSGVICPETAHLDLADYATRTKRGGNPVEHWVFSWPASEKPTPLAALVAVQRAIELIGVPADCPRTLGIHDDTDNLHVHVVLSRYRPIHDTTWSTGRLLDKMHAACRQVEIEHGFAHDNGNYVVVERADGAKTVVRRSYVAAALSAEASRVEAYSGKESLEAFAKRMAPALQRCLEAASNWDRLHEALALGFGLGLRQHGKGFVIVDLKSKRGAATKASFGGLSSPVVTAKLGAWRQHSDGIEHVRELAKSGIAPYSPPAPAPAPAPVGEAIATQDDRERLQHRTRKDENYARRRRRALEAKEQEGRNRLRYSLYTEIDVRVSVVVLPQLRHLEAIEHGSHVEYRRGGKALLVDWGGSVEVMSEIEADIDDAITLLLATRPELARLGVEINGTDKFIEAASQALARRGIHMRCQGKNSDHVSPLQKGPAARFPRL